MEWLMANWFLLVAAIAVLAGAAYMIWVFIKMPKEERWKKVSAWLRYAVAEAEKALGSGTGELKLVMVYDMFVGRFPTAKLFMSYATFKYLVEQALVWMRAILSENTKVEAYIKGPDALVAVEV